MKQNSTERMEKLNRAKEASIASVEAYISSLIASGDSQKLKEAEWFSRWLKKMTLMRTASPKNYRAYAHGEIARVDLGCNIGSEEGMPHYVVVVENGNRSASSVVTVVPLTSVKEERGPRRLKDGELYLGGELRDKLEKKADAVRQELVGVNRRITELKEQLAGKTPDAAEQGQLKALCREKSLLSDFLNDICNVRNDSIALINQITTISKDRIYAAGKINGFLRGVTLSDATMRQIENGILKRFLPETDVERECG